MSYLKLKMQADRAIALSIERSLVQLKKDTTSTVQSVRSGAERASWYGSCLFDDYKDVCKQLRQEDTRMLLSIRQVYQRKDVVLDMVEIYFKIKLSRISVPGQHNIIRTISEKLASHASDKFSKLSIAYTIAKLITESHDFKASHINIINKSSLVAVSVLSFYGKMQTAALSARKLQFSDPNYYSALYKENLELLYFMIEPEMNKIIYLTNSGASDEEEIIFLMNKILTK
ncbi:hypothetical protein [Serratia marcescens]|uniref:Uncharacterized protein n=1 Tax=Serratia marcescens TaxID=615 RepID=A0ABD6HLV0_SERMA|nr:hypothetical protein [Serratia marcescens]MDV5743060.1 hypothetical protein [Serratia marcescens]MDV5747971.1 hypothetical protein [Serratia marcescens]MDV5779408.1 hypothetical protein [Serratia marcescens]MDV5784350.1 hypothetical protein [Serratia marcescens]MDV5831247.1 hypothetical protein [Serratia marcescens]